MTVHFAHKNRFVVVVKKHGQNNFDMDVFGSRLKMRLSPCMSGKLNEKQVLCFSSCAGTVLQFTEVRLTKCG